MIIITHIINVNYKSLQNKIVLTEGEKEGGLAAVALTIGEENVKGSQGGVEAAGLS